MSLTKTISALLTTIGIAVPSALTTWVLTKPKPPKEIEEVIKLDEYIEEINEPEITPQKAPTSPSSIPTRKPLQTIPEGSQFTDSELTPDDSLEPSEASGGEESQQQESSSSVDIPELPPPPPAPLELPEKEEEESKEEEEEQETTKPDEKEDEDEKEPEDKDIKESISEAIRIIIQKYNDGYRVETGGIYDSFEIKKHLEYLVTSINYLKQNNEKEKESQEANAQ